MSSKQLQSVLELTLWKGQNVVQKTTVRLVPDIAQALPLPENPPETADGDCACVVLDGSAMSHPHPRFCHSEEQSNKEFLYDESSDDGPPC